MRSRLVKNYLYNVIYQALVFLAPLITTPYLARVLGAYYLGKYSYVNSSTSIITTIGLIGLYNYGIRQIAYCPANKEINIIFWEIMVLRFVLLIPCLVIYIAFAFISNSLTLYMLYILWVLAVYVDVSWLYIGVEDMKPAVTKNILAKLFCIVGIFIFVQNKDDLWKYVLLVAVATFIANGSLWLTLGEYIGKPQIKIINLKKHIVGGTQLFLPQVATTLHLNISKIMLNWLADSSQVSFYDIAEKFVSIPLAFITVLGTVMMPRIASQFANYDNPKTESLLNQALDYSMFMAIPMMFGIVGIASNLIPWYLGTEFTPCIFAIYYMSIMIILNSLASISGNQYFTATNQVHILIKAYVAAVIANVSINIILIPKFGYAGATIAMLISSLISVSIQYIYLKKQIKISIIKIVFLKYLLFSIIMAGTIYAIGYWHNPSIITTLLQVTGGGVIYLLILIITQDNLLKSVFKKIFPS